MEEDPVPAVSWSDIDLSHLTSGIDYDRLPDDFRTRYTRDAWRSKRRRVRSASPALSAVEPLANEEDWESLFQSIEDADRIRGLMRPTEKTIQVQFTDTRPIGVCFFGDLHAGSGGVDYDRFRTDLTTIAASDGLYAVFMGDAMENTKTSLKSATALYSAAMPNPTEQEEYVRRRLALVKHKLIALCQGNHDQFDYRVGGVDRLASIAANLETTYFTEAGGSILLTIGSQKYHIIVKHDAQGKSKMNKSNAGRRLFDEWPWHWENADVICLAHLHEPDCHTTMRHGHPVTYLRSGTYKYLHDGWAEAGGYRPAYGVPMVILSPEKKEVLPFPGHLFDQGVKSLSLLRNS